MFLYHSAVEISSSESQEAMLTSVYMDNYFPVAHDMNIANYNNGLNACYAHSLYDIHDPSSGFIEESVTNYSEIYASRSVENIWLPNEINHHLQDMNYGWPSANNGWSQNDGAFLEHLQVN